MEHIPAVPEAYFFAFTSAAPLIQPAKGTQMSGKTSSKTITKTIAIRLAVLTAVLASAAFGQAKPAPSS